MSHSEYVSSPKVIFSDRGSIAFGFIVILAMVIVSLVFLICKFQKTAPSLPKAFLHEKKGVKPPLLLKHPYLFRSSKFNYLLFFMSHKKMKAKTPSSPATSQTCSS